MKVLLYGSDVRTANLFSIDDRIVIVDPHSYNILCNISKNLYHMLVERAYITDVHSLKNAENNLYNIISRMTGLTR
jgi:hypothetical protein